MNQDRKRSSLVSRIALAIAVAAGALAATSLAQGNDSCATPQPIAGNGLFPFDNTAATTAAPPCGCCAAMDKNVWFRWQAPVNGCFMQTFGNSGLVQARLSVYEYQGAGCPPALGPGGTSAMFCSHPCNLTEACVGVNCIAGLYYLIEVGSAPGQAGQTGFLDIVIASGGSITPFCPGDGTSGACPCANSGAAGHGCQNSAATGGALLSGSGNPSLSSDTVQLTSAGELPTALTIFLQGNSSIGPAIFGDGLRCAGGTLKRLRVENAVNGTSVYPDGTETHIATQSANLGDPIPAGGTRYYQAYYRDPSATFCPSPTGNTWNVSNGVTILWGA